MTTIRINKALFYTYHGVLDHEKELGNKFEADIEMLCDLSELKNDTISETLDYREVYNTVKDVFTSVKYNLIETLNEKVGETLLSKFPEIISVTVSIRKPNAPLGLIDSVEIIRTFERK